MGFFVGHVYPELIDSATAEKEIQDCHYTGTEVQSASKLKTAYSIASRGTRGDNFGMLSGMVSPADERLRSTSSNNGLNTGDNSHVIKGSSRLKNERPQPTRKEWK